MSPEQALGRPIGTASDFFAFGIVLYEMLAGTHPWARQAGVDIHIKSNEVTGLAMVRLGVTGTYGGVANHLSLCCAISLGTVVLPSVSTQPRSQGCAFYHEPFRPRGLASECAVPRFASIDGGKSAAAAARFQACDGHRRRQIVANSEPRTHPQGTIF